MSDQLWTRSSLQWLSDELYRQGFAISPPTVAAILKFWGYSMHVNQKRLEASSNHPDRDLQFDYIYECIDAFTLAGLPIISVDSKKKELIGNFKNAGHCWTTKPEAVNVHDFKSEGLGRAVPYGIYLPNRKEGYVYVGNSADTSEFAVDCIQTWWLTQGQRLYPTAKELLILADGGGSNSHHYHLWKEQLQLKLSNESGLKVSVSHYPPGCSKWNPIEHRLFGPISINWAGQPLLTFEKMLELIRGASQEVGLKVKAFLREGIYKTGIQVAKEAVEAWNIFRYDICPHWNYTIAPASETTPESNVLANIGKLFI